MARKRVIIIGGVAGGASCAARLRRLDESAAITMVERGPYISYANCGLPYHLGGVIPERESLLVQTAEVFAKRFAVDVRTGVEAVSIDARARKVRMRAVESGEETTEPYDYLVLSPGAEPIRPPIPGAYLPGVMTLRSIPDLDRMMNRLSSGAAEAAVVVGAGFIGLEVAENLRHRGVPVTLVEMADRVLPVLDREVAAPLAAELSLHGVDVRTDCSVKEITASDGGGLLVRLSGDSESIIPAGMVVLATGVRPETALAETAGLELGPSGGIAVDERLRTSDERILAVGDAVEVSHLMSARACRLPLAGPANRQGRLAADVIAGRDVSYRGALGTSIVKIFRMTAGAAGLTESLARLHEVPFEAMWIHGTSHAGYYPGATPLSLKLLFDPSSGLLLGAQATGQEGVDKRLDVLATAMTAGMTVYDLERLDLAYAPPFSSAKDPVNHVGSAAANLLRGDHPGVRADEVEARLSSGDVLVDVRTKEEFECGSIAGAMSIPLDELRARADELSSSRRVLVYCQVGIRGYLATRILAARGVQCANVLGGYRTWLAFNAGEGSDGVLCALDSGFRIGADDMVSGTSGDGACVPNGSRRVMMEQDPEEMMKIDARRLACPGPILKVKEAMDGLAEGGVLQVTATDPAFSMDLPAWAKRSGAEVLSLEACAAGTTAVVRKAANGARSPDHIHHAPGVESSMNGQTIVVFSGDLDKGLAAMIIATGAAAMGKSVTLFFTFWGLNLLRNSSPPALKKSFVERMFGWMMPRGARKARLSKMNMGGAGTAMMRGVMASKNVASLPEMMSTAKRMNIRLVACQMSMDVMGIHREELLDGVEIGGVATYLDSVEDSHHNLFI